MSKDLLIYIKFEKEVWTLLGGIRTSGFTINREPVESPDFQKDFRILIPGSGVKSVDASGSGVFDGNKEMFRRIQKIVEDGTEVKLRLRANEIFLEGPFLIPEFSGDSNTNDAKSFNIRILSSGEIENKL